MFRDLRVGLRMLRRAPAVSLLVILCLTLGIGANAAVFSWIEGVLLRPYPQLVHPERLFVLSGTRPGAAKGTDVSWPDFQDLQRNSTLCDAFIAEKITGTTLSTSSDRAERASGSVVSANYFDALGVRPILGRTFQAVEETGRNAHPVVVISYQLWKERFGGDPGVIGRVQMLNGVPHTIIGIAPEDFYGTFVGYKFQFWVPASMQETFDPGGYKLEDRSARWIEGFVTLKPGVTVEQAQAEIGAAAKRLETEFPATNRGRGIQLLPVWRSPFNPMDALFPMLGIALAVVASVLLIVCANVGNLLLLKSVARRNEMSIRLAVGAARGRLVRQFLTEGLILSTFAAIGGLVVAVWSRDLLTRLFPPRGGTVLRLPADLDWRVLLMSVGVCLIATLLCGLAPALLTSNVNLVDALKSDSGGVVGGQSRAWVRSSLVLVQVSLSFVLLAGAGLVIRSLDQMRTVSPGFATERVLLTNIDLVAAGYDTQRAQTLQEELLRRLQSLSGVQSAAFVRVAPFSYRGYSSAPIAVDGYDAPPDQAPVVDYDEVGPGYFSTIGLPLMAGREFTRDDDERSALVAVVNEAMAAQYWRSADPIGRRLQLKGRSMRVIGVARQAKYGTLLETPKAFAYVPLRQNALGQALVIRTPLRSEAMAAALTRELHALDPNLAASEMISMREQIDRTTSAQIMAVRLLTVFGALAVLLAGVGLYGVMSSAVSQNTREFGLRLALGATAADVRRLVLWRGLTLAAAGVALGIAAALELTRLMGSLLYHVNPRDPASFAAAFAAIALASVAACLVPAWRATRADPLLALRG